MPKVGRPLSFDRNMALDLAMHTFWRYGYEGASITTLTSAMGITPPSLYSAFGDKQALYLEALAHYMRRSEVDLELLLESSTTAYQAMERMLFSAAIQQTKNGQPRGCMLMSARVNSPPDSPIDKAIIKLRRSVRRIVEQRIQKGIRDGDVPAHAVAADLANLHVAVLQGMSVMARDGATRSNLHNVAESALRSWPVSPAAS